MTYEISDQDRKNYRAWETQRILNAAPEWSNTRTFPGSVGNQILNPIACSIQETIQQLFRERYNMFLTLADLNQLDMLYRVDLPQGLNFNYTENSYDKRIYVPPTIYAVINGAEEEITQAVDNTLENLQFSLLSRIEYNGVFVDYSIVLSESNVKDLDTATIINPTIPGHLYITISGNTNWQVEVADKFFYNKIYITGTTRKGVKHTEAIPIRYNSTFRTNYEWLEIEKIYGSYFSDEAKITVESFNTNSFLDTRNIFVSSNGTEKQQYLNLATRTFGSSFIAEVFTANSFDNIRLGMEGKEPVYELELLDSNQLNVELSSFVPYPNTDLIYAIDDMKLYVYDIKLPYNSCKELASSAEARFDLYIDKHFISKDDSIKIKTRNLSVNRPPYATRWILTDPNDNKYFVQLDGTLIPFLDTLWHENLEYSGVKWMEQEVELSFDTNGLYIITFEARYVDEETLDSVSLETKTFVFVPTIIPEEEFNLPVALRYSDRIVMDSNNKIWLLKDDVLYNLETYYDYFLVDYESNKIWLRENYSSVRVDLNA
jgi:hypothetical protein